MVELDESDVTFETTRSGGPGGQNVDSRATAARARIRFENLPLSGDTIDLVRQHIPPKNRAGDDEIFVENAAQRSQRQNKNRALELLNEEINNAIERGRHAIHKKQRKQRINNRNRGGSGGGSESIKDKKQKQFREETMDDLLEQAYEEDPDLTGDSFTSEPDEPED